MPNKPGQGLKPDKPKRPEKREDGAFKRQIVAIALSPEQRKKLKWLADDHGVSRSGYIGQLIDDLELTATQLQTLSDHAKAKNTTSAALIADWINSLS